MKEIFSREIFRIVFIVIKQDNRMITRLCDKCHKEFPVEEMLYCSKCYKCYCPDCAASQGECDCREKLNYFD